MKSFLTLSLILLLALTTKSQDTFSIVGLDSTTRQVGSAGASCVDLFAAGYTDCGFLGELFPDSGAINSQAAYDPTNQVTARKKLRTGATAAEIVAWMKTHDVAQSPSTRQYGVVTFKGQTPSAAGYTGTACENYKNHITGNIDGFYYSIQGNILQGQHILDSMEAHFRRTPGDLACKLMAALQGAKVVGADTRCAPNGTSTLFAFLKVMEPTDKFGSPTLSLGVRTHDQDRKEPIDSLQQLFNKTGVHCFLTSIEKASYSPEFNIHPNPTSADLTVTYKGDPTTYTITDLSGKTLLQGELKKGSQQLPTSVLAKGTYFIHFGLNSTLTRFVKQ